MGPAGERTAHPIHIDLVTIIVDDFDQTYSRLAAAGVEFTTQPRREPYGRVAVFRDIASSLWDLLGQ